MNSIQDVFDTLKNQDLEQYREVMKYCESRVTADEGIPAIIGLDDLTASWNTTYEGAAKDEGFHLILAAGAMVFASLYEELSEEELGHYPGIAPAMSAVAELFFHGGEDGEAVEYRRVVREFLKEKEGGGEDGSI